MLTEIYLYNSAMHEKKSMIKLGYDQVGFIPRLIQHKESCYFMYLKQHKEIILISW
jgi:hypothetical protein